MNLQDLRIVVDEREKKSGIPDLLRLTGIKMEIKTLPVGDYIVGPETIVERKSIHDLLSSIFDGRLFDQCSRLKKHFAYPLILMEGNVDDIDKIAENPFVLYGAISRIALDFKIPIIATPNATHTVKLLVSLCAKKDSSTGPFLKKIKKSNDVQKQQLSILASLPGVGEKLATRMLQRFGTPMAVLKSSVSDLAKVEGLGNQRAKKIKKMLGSKSVHYKPSSQKTLHDS